MTLFRSKMSLFVCRFFFFNDTATTEIYTLSLHDALPIFLAVHVHAALRGIDLETVNAHQDRKSTRLNSSHTVISYAVFCLKKKKYEKPDNITSTIMIRSRLAAPKYKPT